MVFVKRNSMNIQRAIKFLRPGSKFCFNGDLDYQYLVWQDQSTVMPTLAQLTEADLAASQASRIARAKREAAARIYALYPAYAQSNAALGLYNALPNTDPFFPTNMTAGIQAIITAEHTAETAINAMTNSDAVDAFIW